MKKVVLIFLPFALISTLILYFCLGYQNLTDEAFSFFVKKEYDQSAHLLSKDESLQKEMAFVKLNQQDLQGAYLLFQKALYVPHSDEENGEILLGKALTCYLQKRAFEMPSSLEKAKKIQGITGEYLLIEGLFHYEMGNFEKAIIAFSEAGQKEKKGKSWLQVTLANHFPRGWIESHLGIALCEMGEFAKGRIFFEKYLDVPSLSQKEKDLTTLFLGYSHLKEGAGLPFCERESFIKVALFYFDHAQKVWEKEKILPTIVNETLHLLKEERGLPYAFCFIRFLEKCKERSSLELIATKLVEKLNGEHQCSLALCNAVRKEFTGKTFHQIVLEKYFLTLQSQLKEKRGKHPFEFWQKMEALSETIPEHFVAKMGDVIQEEIICLLPEEKENLSRILPLLKFWSSVEKDVEKRNAFASLLLSQGMLFWRKANEELKGTKIINLALHIGSEETREKFSKDIKDFFLTLYHYAHTSNLVGRLSLIYDAMQEFKIPFNGLLTKEELANHLADAAYFFSVHNYSSAKLHAEWVMKIDPKNEEAGRIVGLSSFHLGHYQNAVAVLRKFLEPDEEMKEALSLSEAYFEEESKGVSQGGGVLTLGSD